LSDIYSTESEANLGFSSQKKNRCKEVLRNFQIKPIRRQLPHFRCSALISKIVYRAHIATYSISEVKRAPLALQPGAIPLVRQSSKAESYNPKLVGFAELICYDRSTSKSKFRAFKWTYLTNARIGTGGGSQVWSLSVVRRDSQRHRRCLKGDFSDDILTPEFIASQFPVRSEVIF
jgi:hypothetical protein